MGARPVDPRTPPDERFFCLQLELRLAAALQERLGKQPRLFLLAVMMRTHPLPPQYPNPPKRIPLIN